MNIVLQDEAQLVEDGLALEGFPSNSCRYDSSDNDLTDSDDAIDVYRHSRSAAGHKSPFVESKKAVFPTAGRMKQELKRRRLQYRWSQGRVCVYSEIIYFLNINIAILDYLYY